MSIGHSPKIVTNGLVFMFDAANPKSTKLVGSNSTNYNIYSDLITGTELTGTTNLYRAGKTYYTCYGLTYPESSQTPASREGITQGLNDITSAKLYDTGRDMGFWVFDEDTDTWLADTYFNGIYNTGHCYDTYGNSATEHPKFQADYDTIKGQFPNATYIIIGSHAAENNDNDPETLSRLQELGLPDSHIGVGRPEYVLVGKPNKPSTQHYLRENVSTAVAHMNIGLPLEPKDQSGGMVFGGTEYLNCTLDSSLSNLNVSVQQVIKTSLTVRLCPFSFANTTQTGNTYQVFDWWIDPVASGSDINFYIGNGTYDGYTAVTINSLADEIIDTYALLTVVRDYDTIYLYLNDTLFDSVSGATTIESECTSINIGRRLSGGSTASPFYGEIANTLVYNRVLSPEEVKQNFNATRKRFGI